MTGMDWAYEHNWVSEEEMDKAREKELVLNIWRDFAFIIISDLKMKNELEFIDYFDCMLKDLKVFMDNATDINDLDFLDRNINHLMLYNADFKKFNETEIFYFINSFADLFKFLKEKS